MHKLYTFSLIVLSNISILGASNLSGFQVLDNKFVDSSAMTSSIQSNQPLEVSCSTNQNVENEVILDLQIKNVSNKTVHILNDSLMPYRILQDDGSLLILQAVTPPNPYGRYFAMEVPPSRPVAPAEVVSYPVKLKPLYLEDYYDYQTKPTDLQGLVKVHCQVAWNEKPVTEEIDVIYALLEWQNLTPLTTIEVQMP